ASKGQIQLGQPPLAAVDLAPFGTDRVLAATPGGIAAVDVSLPARPVLDAALTAELETGGGVSGVAVADSLILAADTAIDRVVVCQTGLFPNPLKLAEIDVQGEPGAIVATADAAFVAVVTPDGRSFLRVVDLTDPDFPISASQELAGPARRLRLVGNEVWVA